MKLSICLTVALTALSVAAAPSLGSPVHLQERGGFGAAAGLVKAASKFSHHVPKNYPTTHKPPHHKPGPRNRKPSRPRPHTPYTPLRRPPGRPQIRLPPKYRPAPKPKSIPPPPPPPPPTSDPFADVGGMLNDAASQNEPHFSVGSLFRRNGVYYYI